MLISKQLRKDLSEKLSPKGLLFCAALGDAQGVKKQLDVGVEPDLKILMSASNNKYIYSLIFSAMFPVRTDYQKGYQCAYIE